FSGQAQFLREADIENLLRISMKGQNLNDELAIRLHGDATNVFDSKFDALKFGAGALSISTLTSDNKKLAINSVNSLDCDNTIPIVIEGAKLGNFTMDFSGIETFSPETTLYLRDITMDKTIDLATTSQYAFSVTDLSALKSRFEILVDRPDIETEIAVAGSKICESDGVAYLTLQNSQANVKYSALWNGLKLSEEVSGNGGELQIPIASASLPQGDNMISVSAQMFSCDIIPLQNNAIVSVLKNGSIESVEGGSACQSGSVLLKVNGTDAAYFNWYENIDDLVPITGQNTSEFNTPLLTKSKTYFVSAVNTMGCEGERVEVKAAVTNFDEVTIQVQGNTLISSYESGNQWYLNSVAIENGTGPEIEVSTSGLYSVTTTIDGCSTSAAREMLVTGSEEIAGGIQLYPNPTADKISIEIRTNNPVTVRLISATGVSLNFITLEGDGGKKTGLLDLIQYPEGT
ncbi:MAG: hypothetical protein C0490_24180, partial [Marivirga sp.]|nr:hypothetical protein [Marivirga sp.]